MLFRIQKLISCEYKDFEETVLVESPFAQVTEYGFGMRQVQIALTEKNLIIGVDVFNYNETKNLSNVFYKNGRDPEIECMELVTVIPLKLISIKIYREDIRRIMKISLNETKNLYFEFGGFIFQNLFWNIWCDRVTMVTSLNDLKSNKIIPSTSSSDNEVSKQYTIIADVHPIPSGSSLKENKIDCNTEESKAELTPINSTTSTNLSINKENSNHTIESNPKKHLLNGKKSLNKIRSQNQKRALKNVAQFLIDTHSDVVLNSSQKDLYEENCKHAYYRTASVGDLFPFWNKGW